MKNPCCTSTAIVVSLLIAAAFPVTGQVPGSLQAIEDQYVAAFQAQVEAAHQSKIAELNSQYISALENAFQAASKGDRLDEAVALKEEIAAVGKGEQLRKPDGVPLPIILKLRSTYRSQVARLTAARDLAAGPIVKNFDEALSAYQSALTKAGKVDEALAVKAYREAGIRAKLIGKPDFIPNTANTPVRTSSAQRNPVLTEVTKEKPFTNSLGMKFVPVPNTRVLFCIHETRFRDYAEYAAANPGIDTLWQTHTGDQFKPAEGNAEHPVVNVNWGEAVAFCQWLSERDNQVYRLPTDEEWSAAVGLGRLEKASRGDTPESIMRRRDQSRFPWGEGWPPPDGAGNYSDQSRKSRAPSSYPGTNYIDGYDDGIPTTAPVMSFAANEFGIFDLGGNVWEWVDDWWNDAKTEHTARGASYRNDDRGSHLLSSYRVHLAEVRRQGDYGFRIVVTISGKP